MPISSMRSPTPSSAASERDLPTAFLDEGMTHALTDVLRLEATRQLEERWNGMEKWVNDRMRVVEMQLMHMERQFWKRSHAAVFKGPPRTPLSSVDSSSLSSLSSITPISASPDIDSPRSLDACEAPCSPESTSWLYSIMEDTESPLPGTPTYLHTGAAAFQHALLLEPSASKNAKAGPATDLPQLWAPPPSPPAVQPESLNIQAKLRALLGSDRPELSAELQRILKHGPHTVRRSLLEHMQPILIPLAQDHLGHFVVLRALRVEPALGQRLCGHAATLVRNPHGARVVQYLLDQDSGLQHRALTELLACDLSQTLLAPEALPVWRQVLSTDWTDSSIRSRFRSAVNEALQGQWVATANTEGSSALCQSLVEHHWLGEHDSGVQELLDHFLDIACHQWGVWVVQHMLEHGTAALRAAIAHRLLQAANVVSLSSYGGKAIQSALQWCGDAFQRSYAERLCQLGGPVRPSRTGNATLRPLLIDLAAAQHGLPIITEVREATHTALDHGSSRTAHPHDSSRRAACGLPQRESLWRARVPPVRTRSCHRYSVTRRHTHRAGVHAAGQRAAVRVRGRTARARGTPARAARARHSARAP